MAFHRQAGTPSLAAIAALLASCGGGSGGDAPAGATSTSPGASYGITLSNLQIADALYRDSARTPAGFYADPPPAGQSYVATFHLDGADIGQSQATEQELCSDDWNQALQWSEQAAGSGNNYAHLVGTGGDARYFEFDRVRYGQPDIYQRARVYQCSYLDRSGNQPAAADGAAGIFNQRPITGAELRQLAEYLWRFTGYNNYGHAVLASSGDSVGGALRHTLTIASLSAGSNGCDRVEVTGWRHSVDVGNGALTRRADPLWSFNVRQNAGVAESCTP